MNGLVNIEFFKKLKLRKVTLVGILVWLIIFLFSNIYVVQEIDFFAFLYIFLCYLFLFFGFYHSNTNIKPKDYVIIRKSLIHLMYFTLILALVGFFFRFTDKFIIRGIQLGNSSIDNRLLLEENQSSILGVIGAFLSPFSFIPLFLLLITKSKSKIFFVISLLVFLNPISENIILGARFGILMVLLLLVLMLIHFKKIKFTRTRIIVFLMISYVMALVATEMFLERTKEFAITDKVAIKHILTNAGYNFTIKPTEEYRNEVIESSNKYIQLAKLAKINIAQYYIHGVFEFNYLYQNHDKPLRYGAYMFSIFPKLSNVIFRTNFDLAEIGDSMPRKGVYSTFFGPLYVDFGWFGPIFMFLFGVFQSIIYNKVLSGNFKYIPLLLYFMIIDFFMPVVNFIVSAQGLYIILAFIAFIVFYKSLVVRKVLKNTKLNKNLQ